MVAQGVRLEGLSELRRALREAPGRLDKEMAKAGKEAVNRAIVPAVRSGAPVLTGRLAGSVRGTATARHAFLTVGSEKRVPYAGPINFGWAARGIAAQEFIYRGIAQADGDIVKEFFVALDNASERIAPKGHF